MADTLKIQIDLNGSNDGASGLAGIPGQTANSNAQAFYALNRATAAAKQVATQIVNRRIEAITGRTSNNALQERISTGLNVVVNAVDIAATFPTNPTLATLKLISQGASFAFGIANIVQHNREVIWQNRSASELARRAGYLSDQNR